MLHQDLKYAHQQTLLHFQIKVGSIFLAFSGQKLVSSQPVPAEGNTLRTTARQEQGASFAGVGKILHINIKIKNQILFQMQSPAEI